MSYEADQINNALSMRQMVEHYNIAEIKNNSFIKCPFHHEKTASLSMKKTYFKCFGCGASGDIVRFIMMYFNLNYVDAVTMLDNDFLLGLGFAKKQTLRERKEAKERQQEYIKKRAEQEQLMDTAVKNYWIAFDKWKCNDDNIMTYKPNKNDTEFNPIYIDAIRNKAIIDYRLDCAEYERQVIECATK